MPRFIPYNIDQDTMVVINFRHQLQPGTFEYAVRYLIEHKLGLFTGHRNREENESANTLVK